MTNSIIFCILETRLDIVFDISIASWFAKNSGYQYRKGMKLILQYLKSSRKLVIIDSSYNDLSIEGY